MHMHLPASCSTAMSLRRTPALPWPSRACAGMHGCWTFFLSPHRSPSTLSFLPSLSGLPSSFSHSRSSSFVSSIYPAFLSSSSLSSVGCSSARHSCTCVASRAASWICCIGSSAACPATCCMLHSSNSSSNTTSCCSSCNSSHNSSGCGSSSRRWGTRRKSVSAGRRSCEGSLTSLAADRRSQGDGGAFYSELLRRMQHVCLSLEGQKTVAADDTEDAFSPCTGSTSPAASVVPSCSASLTPAFAGGVLLSAAAITTHRSQRCYSCQPGKREDGRAAATTQAAAARERGTAGKEASEAATANASAAEENVAARATAAAVEIAATATEGKSMERSQERKRESVKRQAGEKKLATRKDAGICACSSVGHDVEQETRADIGTVERNEGERAREKLPAIGFLRQHAARKAGWWKSRAAATATTSAPLSPEKGFFAAASFSRLSETADSSSLILALRKAPPPLHANQGLTAALPPAPAVCDAAAASSACARSGAPAAAAAATSAVVVSTLPGVLNEGAAHGVEPAVGEAHSASSASLPAAAADGRGFAAAAAVVAAWTGSGFHYVIRKPAAAAAANSAAGDAFTAERASGFLPAAKDHCARFLSTSSLFSSSSFLPTPRMPATLLSFGAVASAAPTREDVGAVTAFAAAASSSCTGKAAAATATPVAAFASPTRGANAVSARMTAALSFPAAARAAASHALVAAASSASHRENTPAGSPAAWARASSTAACPSSCSSSSSRILSTGNTRVTGDAVSAPRKTATCADLSEMTSLVSPAVTTSAFRVFSPSRSPAAVVAAAAPAAGTSSDLSTRATPASSSFSCPSSFRFPFPSSPLLFSFSAISFLSSFSVPSSSDFTSASWSSPSALLRCAPHVNVAVSRASNLRKITSVARPCLRPLSAPDPTPHSFSSLTPSSFTSRAPLSSVGSSSRSSSSVASLSSTFPPHPLHSLVSPHFASLFLSCVSLSSVSSATPSACERASSSPVRGAPVFHANDSEWRSSSLSPLRAEELQVQPKLLSLLSATPDPSRLGFGQYFTDHMIEVDWDDVYGWYSPVLRPLAPVSVHPGVSALHYAISAFEGLKAFRATDDRLLLFRPHDHARRLVSSCKRVTLPSFSAEALVKLCKQLVRADSRFVFPEKGLSLYLRPIVFSTYPTLGVHPPRMAKMLIMACPTSGYFSNAGEGTHLYVEQEFRRSWPGSAGSHKVAANYAPSILPCKIRMQQGFQQLLWTAPASVSSRFRGKQAEAAAARGKRGTEQEAGDKSQRCETEEVAKWNAAGETTASSAAAATAGGGRAVEGGLSGGGGTEGNPIGAMTATQREGGTQSGGEKGAGSGRETATLAAEKRGRRKDAGTTAAATEGVSTVARAGQVATSGETGAVREREEGGSRDLLATAGEEDDLLWCEGGAMSIFIFWKNENGEEELATPALERDLILPGIMRDTVLHIARTYPDIKVATRRILMRRDFLKAYEEGRVHEVFCTGTGAVVVPVAVLHFEGRNFNCMPSNGSASLAQRLLNDVYKIQYGEVPHHFVEEC